PESAAALRATRPVAEPPPTRFCVVREIRLRIGTGVGVTASVALCVVPSVAEIVAVVAADTALVFTVKLALLAPAGTVTLAGTVTAFELSERGTTRPPVGAAPFRNTNPVAAVPPATLDGLTDTQESDGAVPV